MVRIIGTLGKYDQRRLWKWTCINPFDLLFKKNINHKNPFIELKQFKMGENLIMK